MKTLNTENSQTKLGELFQKAHDDEMLIDEAVAEVEALFDECQVKTSTVKSSVKSEREECQEDCCVQRREFSFTSVNGGTCNKCGEENINIVGSNIHICSPKLKQGEDASTELPRSTRHKPEREGTWPLKHKFVRTNVEPEREDTKGEYCNCICHHSDLLHTSDGTPYRMSACSCHSGVNNGLTTCIHCSPKVKQPEHICHKRCEDMDYCVGIHPAECSACEQPKCFFDVGNKTCKGQLRNICSEHINQLLEQPEEERPNSYNVYFDKKGKLHSIDYAITSYKAKLLKDIQEMQKDKNIRCWDCEDRVLDAVISKIKEKK